MKNYPLGLFFTFVLIVLSNITYSVGYLDDSNRPPMKIKEIERLCNSYRALELYICQEDKTINFQIAKLKYHLVHHFTELSIRVLKRNFPSCYTDVVGVIVEDISKIFNDQSSIPCFMIFNPLKHHFRSLLGEIADDYKLIDRHRIECIENPLICGIAPTYRNAVNRLGELVTKFSFVNRWSDLWNLMKKCYEDALFQAFETISMLRRERIICNQIPSYTELLKNLSLWPLTLNTIAHPETYWQNYSETIMSRYSVLAQIPLSDGYDVVQAGVEYNYIFQNSSSVDDFEWMKEKLILFASELNTKVEKYLNMLDTGKRIISTNFLDIFRNTVNKLVRIDGSSLKSILTCKTSSGEQINSPSLVGLYEVCFQPIPRIMNEMIKFQSELSRALGCLRTKEKNVLSEKCEHLVSRIFLIHGFYKSWSEFNLTNTWDFVHKCLTSANYGIIRNINEYKDVWSQDCHTIPLFGAFHTKLPINMEQYPDLMLIE